MVSQSGWASIVASGDGNGKHPLWSAMGGALGVTETLLPGLVFVFIVTLSRDPWIAIAVSVGISICFTLYRILRRQSVIQALVGLVGVVVSAVLALLSNRPEDNFVLGLLTNAAYGALFLISVLISWPLVGLIVGYLRGEGTSWRSDRHHRRVYSGLSLLWFGMFALRLSVEYPLYVARNVEGLATAKLLLGLPLYVPVLALTWLVIRSLSREKTPSNIDSDTRES